MDWRRLVGPFFAVGGFLLIPWTIVLTMLLPATHETEDWRTVWAGFDLMLAAALLATAFAAMRQSPWLEAFAAAAGTLCLVDAWFDMTLEFGTHRFWFAVAEAVVAELPLAAICFWVARDAEAVLAALPDGATSRGDRREHDPESPRPRTRDRRRQEARSRAG
jgi:hypothetical protein